MLGRSSRLAALVAGTMLLVSGLWVATASADTVGPITFEPPTYTLGSPDSQDGWESDGSTGPSNPCSGAGVVGPYDHEIDTNSTGVTSFGSQVLRISSAVTCTGFDHTYSKSTTDDAGETTSLTDGMSGGTRQSSFMTEVQFASTQSTEQPNLSIALSPVNGSGARMSWVRIDDTPTGLALAFNDYKVGTGFRQTNNIASGLSRTAPHTLRIEMDFAEGADNDVVRVFVDGALVHTGNSWEDFFRSIPENPHTVDSVLFRTSGTAAPAQSGNGMAFDGLILRSGPEPQTGTGGGAGGGGVAGEIAKKKKCKMGKKRKKGKCVKKKKKKK